MKRKRIAQSVIEYVFLLSIIAGAFVVMSTFFRRAAQGRLNQISETVFDQIDQRNIRP